MVNHLKNPMPLPHLDAVIIIVTGSTSGIALEIARQLAQAGAHVVMAVRKVKLAHELLHKWQNGMEMPLNVEVAAPANKEIDAHIPTYPSLSADLSAL